MIALVLAALASAQDPVLETGSGFEFALPKGWSREKEPTGQAVVLVPADAKGEVRLILYPPHAVENGTYANEAHFHIAMLQALTESGERKGEPVTGKTGEFQWSRVTFVVKGAEYRLAAYTAKLRRNWALVAFAGPPAAFEAHLPTVEKFVRELKDAAAGKAVAAGAQEIYGLSLPLPEGWTRKDNPQGAVELHSPVPRNEREPDRNFVVLVLPTQPLRGSLWETQRAIFDEVVQGSGLKNPVAPLHEPDTPGPFIRSSTAGSDARNNVRAVRLYGAPSEGGIDCVVVFGQEDFAATGAMLNRASVRKPVKDAVRPKVVAAYRRLSQQTHVEYDRGRQLIIPVPYDRIWLRADGVADFTPMYREGSAASRIPGKIDAALRNGRFGSWKAVGENEVHVVRKAGQAPEVYVRDGASLRLGDKVYEPMPAVDGLVLDGRWVLPGDRKRAIEFTAAGRFKDEGLLEDVGYLPAPAWTGGAEVLYPRPPARGAGTYAIREFTLLLTYDDGTVWSSDFSTMGADPKDVSKLLLKTGELHRVP
jgi:hypothetical protein